MYAMYGALWDMHDWLIFEYLFLSAPHYDYYLTDLPTCNLISQIVPDMSDFF